MAHCHATQDNAQYLASKTGLNTYVALAWLWNECQTTNNPTNPLNILYNGHRTQQGQTGRFATYASPHAGLDDAAWLINNSAYYSGIRQAIKTGDPFKEARAIELSPWAGGNYGGAKAPGNISKRLAALLKTSIPGGAQSTDDTIRESNSEGAGSPSAKPSVDLGAWDNLIHIPVGHALTQADVDSMMSTLKAAGYFNGDSILGGSEAKTREILQSHIGQAWGKPLQDQLSLEFGTAAANAVDPITGVSNAIGAVGNVLVKVVTYALAVVLIVVGLWLYSKNTSKPLEVPVGEG
jgi:hypothetical protein